ncbi:hypothetical protein GE09DRAFT_1129946 [Coniochaeta sp. 2T2.1]|nr:hypothetical protein GE09DRAFT_1129946 [Coniochaeta sp. 2T2.1]
MNLVPFLSTHLGWLGGGASGWETMVTKGTKGFRPSYLSVSRQTCRQVSGLAAMRVAQVSAQVSVCAPRPGGPWVGSVVWLGEMLC